MGNFDAFKCSSSSENQLTGIAYIFHSSLPIWAFQYDSRKPFEMIVRHLTVACIQGSNIYGLGFVYVGIYIYMHMLLQTLS